MHFEATKTLLQESKSARKKIKKTTGVIVGETGGFDYGLYLSNYANCILNRQADIYDDTILLIKNNRIQSACAISRGMIETNAFAKHLGRGVAKTLSEKTGEESVFSALELVINFTNSSKFKQNEQKKIAKGIFAMEDFQFTEQTKHRFENNLATSTHVMNALREVFQDEMKHLKRSESSMELLYDALSEWVHPSQTSIFHNYTPETHKIPSSAGTVDLHVHAKYLCANALHLITDSINVHHWLSELALEITLRGRQT